MEIKIRNHYFLRCIVHYFLEHFLLHFDRKSDHSSYGIMGDLCSHIVFVQRIFYGCRYFDICVETDQGLYGFDEIKSKK